MPNISAANEFSSTLPKIPRAMENAVSSKYHPGSGQVLGLEP